MPRTNPTVYTNESSPKIFVDPTTNVSETTEETTHIETKIIDNNTTSNAPTQMSLTRALVTYLFPIIMAWFGGCFSDLL